MKNESELFKSGRGNGEVMDVKNVYKTEASELVHHKAEHYTINGIWL
jgi:hypothetical protein